MRRNITVVVGLTVVACVAAAWLCRDALKARYYVHRLTTDANESWVARAPDWGDDVAGRLVGCLTNDDEAVCDRVGAALTVLSEAWPDDDVRQTELVVQLADVFASFSAAGQQWSLDFASGRVRGGQPAVLAAARMLVTSGLQSRDAAVRVRAVRLAMRPELTQLEPLLPLLRDAVPEVRRAAVLALGPAKTLMADDDLLPALHDSDVDVQRLVKTALLSRGLSEKQVRMGKYLSSPRPADRLKLVAYLRDDGDHDLCAWLQRLSLDTSPAVRAAAARVAGEQQVFQFAERLAQMATGDPDSTVRPIASYHLKQIQAIRQTSAH